MRGQNSFAWPTTLRSVRPASVGSRGCGKTVGGWFIGLVGRGWIGCGICGVGLG